MRIVLASQSPSRAAILRGAGVEPVCHPAQIDERAIQDSLAKRTPPAQPADIVLALAQTKAQAVSSLYPGDVVIGGDSMLLVDGKLQGKPKTAENTYRRWKEQAGKSAQLLTGHCIVWGDKTFSRVSTTTVNFAQASDADIRAYAATGEPLECAGAFTLEALGGWFIDSIAGDPSSVIGLSLPVVRQALYEFGLNVSDFWNI